MRSPNFLAVSVGVLLALIVVGAIFAAVDQTPLAPPPLNYDPGKVYTWPDSTGASVAVTPQGDYDIMLQINSRGGTNIATLHADGRIELNGDPNEAANIFWKSVSSLMQKDHAFTSNRLEILQLLKECHELMAPKYAYTLEYVSPADQLRRQAARIEHQEDVIKRLKQLLVTLGELQQ